MMFNNRAKPDLEKAVITNQFSLIWGLDEALLAQILELKRQPITYCAMKNQRPYNYKYTV